MQVIFKFSDATKLAVDAVINAGNSSLMGEVAELTVRSTRSMGR